MYNNGVKYNLTTYILYELSRILFLVYFVCFIIRLFCILERYAIIFPTFMYVYCCGLRYYYLVVTYFSEKKKNGKEGIFDFNEI